MTESFVVYVDESGDEGFKFEAGSSEWFILAAVVVRKVNDHHIIDALAKARIALQKPPLFPLHFRDLKHEQRIAYVKILSTLSIRTVSILVHKPCLKEPETFGNYRLYHYCVRFLLERVSWLCRDQYQKDVGDGSAKIVFSNRSSMSYADLRGYVEKLIGTGNPLEVRIEPSVIIPQKIVASKHGQLAGLQAADAVASSFYYAAQKNFYGFTEPRYIEEISRSVYRHENQGIGYGIKFWPKETDQMVLELADLKWANALFKKK